MKLQKEEIVLLNGFNQFNLVDEKGLIVGVVAGFTNEQNLQTATLFENAPELLKVCQNALRDVKAMNEWMVSKGHHGYTLLEQDLEEVLEKSIT
jgi:hypothetical protein